MRLPNLFEESEWSSGGFWAAAISCSSETRWFENDKYFSFQFLGKSLIVYAKTNQRTEE